MKVKYPHTIKNASVSDLAFMLHILLKSRDIVGICVKGTGTSEDPYLTNEVIYDERYFRSKSSSDGRRFIYPRNDSNMYDELIMYHSINMKKSVELGVVPLDTSISGEALKFNEVLENNGNQGIRMTINTNYFEVVDGMVVVIKDIKDIKDILEKTNE